MLLYVLLRGLDATALKWLQLSGAAHAVDGENPISFCNVFFVAQAIVGLSALLTGRGGLRRHLGALDGKDRRLLALHGGLGMFLGPIAAYLALGSLAVISQTLLFALVLPVSALLARWLLREALPRGFWISLSLILAGLLLPQAASAMGGGPMDELIGVGWALVGVVAFAGSAITGRVVAGCGWPPAISVGLPSTLAALVFALIALVLYGPHHFLLLRLWWVVGVIIVYGLALSLGRELALRAAYRRLPVATVSLWGSLSILVAAGSAAVVLGERGTWPTMLGLLLVLIGVCRYGASGNDESQSDRPLGR
ncbi:MAG: DMT family transporter [Prochlorococcaceae cyanobacterium]